MRDWKIQRTVVGSVHNFVFTNQITFEANRLASAGEFDRHVLGEYPMGLGPATRDIVTHVEIRNATTDFQFAIFLERMFHANPWIQNDTGSILIAAGAMVGDSYGISAPFNDREKFGQRLRVVLYTQVKSPTTTAQYADMSIATAVRVFNS